MGTCPGDRLIRRRFRVDPGWVTAPTLACGPFLDETGLSVAIVVFLVFKPLAYFAFIQAFRYRVSRPVPMRPGQAVKLTVARAGLGILFFAIGAAVLVSSGSDALWAWSWVYLYAARATAWLLVGGLDAGGWGARLRGRRLAGWVISGTMLNAAFDVAVVLGAFGGWEYPVTILLGLAAFIAVLDVVGRRASLRDRFGRFCVACSYDLTGNLSGRCPECGAPAAHAE